MTDEREALKPCPWCGSTKTDWGRDPVTHRSAIMCDVCYGQGPWADGTERGYDREAAITAWNARPPSGREPLADGRDHLTLSGTFQSDKYPWCPAGFVPLKITDPMARGPLLAYADARETVDAEFSRDLRQALGGDDRPPSGAEAMREAAAKVAECYAAVARDADKCAHCNDGPEAAHGVAAAIRALPADDGWCSDMALAPRDGRPVELYRPPHPLVGTWATVVIARWVGAYELDDHEWMHLDKWCWPTEQATDCFDDEAFSEAMNSDGFYEADDFTHWRPLPTPPAQGGER